jgi:malate synthase
MRKTRTPPAIDPRLNTAPEGFDPETQLPMGFADFLRPLHRIFTPRQQALASWRRVRLAEAHRGEFPQPPAPSEAATGGWAVRLPEWCRDQRNQLTGPADDAERVVRMLNAGAPGVVLDLEDSLVNAWDPLCLGIENIVAALHGRLSYVDRELGREVFLKGGNTVVFTRPRGLHLSQAGVLPGELMSASLFDVASVAYRAAPGLLGHPLCFTIPKSDSAEEALWWRDLFQALERELGMPPGWIKCTALVESHPLAYQVEEFAGHLREHLVGLVLGRWDYLASLAHFTLEDPAWVLPDLDGIPADAPFFQGLRQLLPEVCHRRGLLALGGMTPFVPGRESPELRERALRELERDARREAEGGFDGAWTADPDQNDPAVRAFPAPNQLARRRPLAEYPELRPRPDGGGRVSLEGTRDAVRTAIRYRFGVLRGRGASVLDGRRENLATDRLRRLMLAQRVRHGVTAGGVRHTPELLTRLFDEELERILLDLPAATEPAVIQDYMRARVRAEQMIARRQFDPV